MSRTIQISSVGTYVGSAQTVHGISLYCIWSIHYFWQGSNQIRSYMAYIHGSGQPYLKSLPCAPPVAAPSVSSLRIIDVASTVLNFVFFPLQPPLPIPFAKQITQASTWILNTVFFRRSPLCPFPSLNGHGQHDTE